MVQVGEPLVFLASVDHVRSQGLKANSHFLKSTLLKAKDHMGTLPIPGNSGDVFLASIHVSSHYGDTSWPNGLHKDVGHMGSLPEPEKPGGMLQASVHVPSHNGDTSSPPTTAINAVASNLQVAKVKGFSSNPRLTEKMVSPGPTTNYP